MLRRPKNIVTAMALVATATVSLAAAVRTVVTGFPDNPASDHTHWRELLSNEDLSERTLKDRRSYAARLERQIRRDGGWKADISQLDPQQRERFLDNVVLLARTLISERADRYERLRPRERERALDREVDNILVWSGLLWRADNPEQPQQVEPWALEGMLKRMPTLLADSDREQQRRNQQFLYAVAPRLVKHFRNQALPGFGADPN